MLQMYPASPNSPGTELSEDISASQTTISVLSTSGLPPAPNLLTLGSDETAETVRYTKVAGTKLTVERGFQGVAKSWSAGTRVARYFTAYDHDTFRENIEEIDAETSDVERKDLTLNVGLQIVESTHDTPFNLGEIKGRTEIHDGEGMTNVKNPYAIVTGGNLLPPFTEWSIASQAKIVSPYHLLLTPESNYNGSYVSIPCVGNTTYTLQGTVTGGGKLYADVRGADGSHDYHLVENGSVTFTTSADATAIDVLCTNDTTVEGNMEFIDVMLTIGTEPKPFTLQQRSMLAFEAELAAHPVDGSNPDTLFIGDDGLPYVLEPWKKVTLDGSLPWIFVDPRSGFKRVAFKMTDPAVAGSGQVTKYDGKCVPGGGTGDAADIQAVSADGHFYISIANTDSGWGPDYTPELDEIKAYFLGWRIGWWNNETQRLDPWDGTQPADQKRWVNILTNGDMQTSLPTEMAKNYMPYRLQYLKAKPTVEPVRNYELGATLTAGSNMVEVGSGIVLREKANFREGTSGENTYYWNSNAYGTQAKSKVDNILHVYKGLSEFYQWTASFNPDSYGRVRAAIASAIYDPTAVYHVTYTMLDPTLAAPINGSMAANLRGTVSDLVQDVGDIGRRLSVVENQKAEKAKKAVWIELTPLNGWGAHPNIKPAYTIMDGVVYFKGRFTKANATTADGTIITKIPEKVSPLYTAYFQCVRGRVSVFANGDLQIYNNEGTADLSIDNISYPLER